MNSFAFVSFSLSLLLYSFVSFCVLLACLFLVNTHINLRLLSYPFPSTSNSHLIISSIFSPLLPCYTPQSSIHSIYIYTGLSSFRPSSLSESPACRTYAPPKHFIQFYPVPLISSFDVRVQYIALNRHTIKYAASSPRSLLHQPFPSLSCILYLRRHLPAVSCPSPF